VMDLQFSPDGTMLVSGSGDFTVRLWDTLPRARRAWRSASAPTGRSALPSAAPHSASCWRRAGRAPDSTRPRRGGHRGISRRLRVPA
jgi:WD40 repeat protein